MVIRKLSLIVAMTRTGLIGKDGDLPWSRLKGDMQWFRRHTWLKPVIVGRRTYESLGGPLEKRINVVLSRQPWKSTYVDGVDDRGVRWARDPLEALDFAGRGWMGSGATEAVVIGGAEVYRIFLPFVGVAHVTYVDGEYDGDVFFPGVFDPAEWLPTGEPLKGEGFSCHTLSRPQPAIEP
jgi:dihydrofolate reductase